MQDTIKVYRKQCLTNQSYFNCCTYPILKQWRIKRGIPGSHGWQNPPSLSPSSATVKPDNQWLCYITKQHYFSFEYVGKHKTKSEFRSLQLCVLLSILLILHTDQSITRQINVGKKQAIFSTQNAVNILVKIEKRRQNLNFLALSTTLWLAKLCWHAVLPTTLI